MRSLATAQPSCAPGWYSPVGALLLLFSLIPFVMTLACLVRLMLPSRTIPRTREHVA